MLLKDVLTCKFDTVILRFNSYGVNGQYSQASPPNAITFLNCEIGVNANYGIEFADATTFTMVGGAVEGNGTTGTDANLLGVMLYQNNVTPGLSGSVAASFLGVYFEGNGGNSDIWFRGGTVGSCALSVTGCTFNRISGTTGQFVTNNINFEVDTGGYKARLAVTGCGFNGYNSYTPSSSRPYIAVNYASGADFAVSATGNIYGSSLEQPALPGPQVSPFTQATAYVNFVGTTGAINQSSNIASVSRTGTGAYTVTFSAPMANNEYAVVGNVGGQAFIELGSVTATSFTMTTVNASGTATDYGYVMLAVFGGISG